MQVRDIYKQRKEKGACITLVQEIQLEDRESYFN